MGRPQKRRRGPRSAYGPKTETLNLRVTKVAKSLVTMGTERDGLSESDWCEAKFRGEDPARVAAKLRADEEREQLATEEA